MKSIHRAVAIATGVLMAATLAAPLAQAVPVEVTVQITQTTPRADGTVPFATTGPWASSSLKGLDGGPSSYSGRSGATATWIPDVPEAGEYRVEAAVPDTASSTTSATYTVVRPSGSTAVSIDQVALRNGWADLGTYAFEAGTGSSVRLTASGTQATRAASLRLVPAEAPGHESTCEAQVTDASAFVPVLGLDLPATSVGLGARLAPAFDRRAEVAQGFDRVGYCLELNGPQGPQWVWTAMQPFTSDAARLDPPTTKGEIVRQRIGDLDVVSNVAGVAEVDGGEGFLEFWPNDHTPARPAEQIFGASATTFDAEDNPTSGAHGSFGIYSVSGDALAGANPQTVLSVTGLTQPPGGSLGIGIGTSAGANPDWTLADNGSSYTTRRLTVFARPAVIEFERAPEDRQLFPRDADNLASVAITGVVVDPAVTSVRARLWKGAASTDFSGPVGADGSFAVAPILEAGLHEYRIEFDAISPAGERRVATWDRLVAGDVYVVQGQSNAEARMSIGSTAADGERSPWIRSYGSMSGDTVMSMSDRTWNIAHGDAGVQDSGFVGQWGLRMGARLVADQSVPVAIFNGASPGKPISWFQRNDADPDQISTNYGRLRQRLAASELLGSVKALLWYQGENDYDNADVHIAGFTALLADWRSDLGSETHPTKYYVWQVRSSPCYDSGPVALRDAQRRLADTHDVTVLSTTGLNGHDGCHYLYVGGYRDMGDQAADVIERDLFDGRATGVSAPNPTSAAFGNSERTIVTVQVRPGAEGVETLTVESGAASDFRVTGATVTAVTAQPGALRLTLSAPVDAAASVSYHGHMGSGPRVLSPGGVGLLAFTMLIDGPEPIELTRRKYVEKVWGSDIANITTKAEQSAYAISDYKGVVFTSVPAGSLAASAGLQTDDLVRSINGTEISEQRNSFWQAYNALPAGAVIDLDVRRASTNVSVELTKPTDPEILNNTSGVVYRSTAAPIRPSWIWRDASRGGKRAWLDDIDATQNVGDSWELTFNGTGIDIISQINTDLGDVDIAIDGNHFTTQSFHNATRLHQQTVLSISDLAPGVHTITGTMESGSYMIVDAFKTHPAVAPALDVAVTAAAKCVGGKVVLSVRATNNEAVPVSIAFDSQFGGKSFAAVATGKNAVHTFTTRQVSVPAGVVDVTAQATSDGHPVTATVGRRVCGEQLRVAAHPRLRDSLVAFA